MSASAWRGRLGIFVNHNDAVPETEFWAMSPPGITIHAARFEGPRQSGKDYGTDAAAAFARSPDLARGMEFFGRMRLDGIFLCFSTASILGPEGFDEELVARLEARSNGIPVTLAAQAMKAAIGAVGARRLMVVVPPWFSDALVTAADAYFTRLGFEVATVYRVSLGSAWSAIATYEIYDRGGQWEVTREHVYRGVRAAALPDIDAVVQIGNGLHAAEAIAPLEEDLGVPVLTANQAGLWHALRVAGIGARIEGYGRLFEHTTIIRRTGG